MKPYLALKNTSKLLINKISIDLKLVQLKPNRKRAYFMCIYRKCNLFTVTKGRYFYKILGNAN